MTPKLLSTACLVLNTSNPEEKVKITRQAYHNQNSLFIDQTTDQTLAVSPPLRPARPLKPELVDPKNVQKRKINRGIQGRVTLLHAIAHIELNAIDLAWDIIARFSFMPQEFYENWLKVAFDEANHFMLLQNRLNEMDSYYGEYTAHDGLWEMAQKTSHDLCARLALVPMVLEARGLDVSPMMIQKLKKAEDNKSAEILQLIHDEEIYHVHVGCHWFHYLCKQKNINPKDHWQSLVQKHLNGSLKPPFNVESREKAGFPQAYYCPYTHIENTF